MWISKQLGELISLDYGFALPISQRDETGTVPVLGSNGKCGVHSEARVQGPGICSRSKRICRFSYVDRRGFLAYRYYVLCDLKERLVPKWIYYLLNNLELSKYKTSTGVPGLNRNDVYPLQVSVPSISEQRRIVEILDQADVLRKQRAEADAKAARILPALFYQMFGDPATNPRGWHTGSLGDVFLSTEYGTSTKANSDSEGLPVLRMNNIDSDGFLDLNELKYVVLSGKEEEKYALVDGDLLFNRTNSKELVGKTGLWRGELKAVFASYLIRVRIDRDQALPEFIWAYMNSPFMKQVLLNKSRRAIGMANINAKELRQFPLMLPPKEQQALFAGHLAGLDELRRWRRRSAKTIESLFQLLVHRAFIGSLTAGWRENHMKELLQEIEHQARALA